MLLLRPPRRDRALGQAPSLSLSIVFANRSGQVCVTTATIDGLVVRTDDDQRQRNRAVPRRVQCAADGLYLCECPLEWRNTSDHEGGYGAQGSIAVHSKKTV